MFNNSTTKQSKASVPAVAIEYQAPHWLIFIRNPGSPVWTPVRSPTRKVRVQDEFGTEVKSYPAIELFPTQSAAEQWVDTNVPRHVRKSRITGGLRALFAAAAPTLQG